MTDKTTQEEVSKYAPKAVLLMSGKRKSGKDFLADKLESILKSEEGLSDRVKIVRLSAPLKKCYAENHGLDYEKLLSSGAYKEQHRLDMIKWSEKIRYFLLKNRIFSIFTNLCNNFRNEDYGYFCRATLTQHDAEKYSVWIVSDCRRPTDLQFFERHFTRARCARVRVCATEEARKSRGWVFQGGVDDAESECGLDGAESDFSVDNSGEGEAQELLRPVLEKVRQLVQA